MAKKTENQPKINPQSMIRPGRKITGMSAILLPFASDGSVDWPAFDRHVERTAKAGLTPAVNMDTGYMNLLDSPTATNALDRTRTVLKGGKFVAGAFVADSPGAAFNFEAYSRQIETIQARGGTPVIFQSFGLTGLDDAALIEAYKKIGSMCDQFIGFELGKMFAPFGRIYDLPVYEKLLQIPQCIGAKHSSLNRVLEWQRLALRDRVRPDFKVFTGNDLAIDMVIYGSDYLLGLSTFAPDMFALRDRLWLEGSAEFYELNDLLQYLGFFAFRDPVPGYKHNAAQFLMLRGWIATDRTHPRSPARPDSDVEVLQNIASRLEAWRGRL